MERTRPGITSITAEALAAEVLAGRTTIPEIGLTAERLRQRQNRTAATMQIVEYALSGTDRAIYQACGRSARSKPNAISRMLVDLLRHGGCDPCAWIVVQEHVDGIELPGPMGGRTVISMTDGREPGGAPVADTHVYLGDDSYWLGRGDLDVTLPIPEAALVAAKGRPLRELISHPALDPYALVIEGIGDNGGDGIMIKTDYDDRRMDTRVPIFALTDDLRRPLRG